MSLACLLGNENGLGLRRNRFLWLTARLTTVHEYIVTDLEHPRLDRASGSGERIATERNLRRQIADSVSIIVIATEIRDGHYVLLRLIRPRPRSARRALLVRPRCR